ncbi:DNA alkylation repair protein [Loigolactobacillus bifermentans]|uniref:DNA alkylation repair protein n=1 Tax=Loigolactobacillus bifermentans TaxID=1607 RepID=UPI00070FCB39|nr:DNA alkylation repair protein [Loigolactobacillus bifermentans]QGG60742.1 6-O-methylguanine DNA methyltransferase [Loigolactobacillus bifermentans]
MPRFVLQGDAEQAPAMARYMKNQFQFLGIRAPDRKQQEKVLLQHPLTKAAVLALIEALYTRPEREYQYVAIDLAIRHLKDWSLADLKFLSQYVTQKAWWDSVDSWRSLFGGYAKQFPETKGAIFAMFAGQSNIWMRRVAITLQLQDNAHLDRTLLTQAIEADLTTDSFFIQKAIGWALRQASKVDPTWVRHFVTTHSLSTLAQREAMKYLTEKS